MTVAYGDLKALTEAVEVLSKKLDERVTTIEEWQKQQSNAPLVSQGGGVPPEGQPNVQAINADLDAKIAQYKELLTEYKEQRLASQRPSYYTGAYAGETKEK